MLTTDHPGSFTGLREWHCDGCT